MGTQKERMLAGELYIADDPELAADHVRARLLLERFNASSVTGVDLRRSLLLELLGHLGEDTEIKPPLQCDYGYQVSIGDRSFVNYGAVFLDGRHHHHRRRRADGDQRAAPHRHPSPGRRDPQESLGVW